MALVFISFPLAIFLDRKGVQNFDYRWLFLVAILSVFVVQILVKFIVELIFTFKRYPKIAKLYTKFLNDNWQKAYKEYPSKQFLNDKQKWEKVIEKQSCRQSELNNISRSVLMKELKISEYEWNKFMVKFLKSNHRENLK